MLVQIHNMSIAYIIKCQSHADMLFIKQLHHQCQRQYQKQVAALDNPREHAIVHGLGKSIPAVLGFVLLVLLDYRLSPCCDLCVAGRQCCSKGECTVEHAINFQNNHNNNSTENTQFATQLYT